MYSVLSVVSGVDCELRGEINKMSFRSHIFRQKIEKMNENILKKVDPLAHR